MKKGLLRSFGIGVLLFIGKAILDHIDTKREEARVNEELEEMVRIRVEEELNKREEEKRQRLLTMK